MCAQLGRALGGCRRQFGDGRAVPSGFRVMSEEREVRSASAQHAQDDAMQVAPPNRPQHLFDRHAGQLVPERHGLAFLDDHPRHERAVEVTHVLTHRGLEQPELGPRRHDRDCIENAARTVVERRGTRENCVADGRRNLVAARRERFGDEEGVPRRPGEEPLRIDVVRLGELSDGTERQPRHLQRRSRRSNRDACQCEAKRMRLDELVITVRRDDEGPRRADPPGQQQDEIERRLVGPVQILDNDQRWLGVQLVE